MYGRKAKAYCKRGQLTTYMPLTISVMRKNVPALSSALSWPGSSHRFGRGNLNFDGGGPAGVADRGELVEKRAT